MRSGGRLVSLLRRLVSVQDTELVPVLRGFGALFCVLAAYFLAQPIRDEAAVALGTQALAPLFIGSLAVTALLVPLATRVLQSAPTLAQGVTRLYRVLSGSLLAFYTAFVLLAQPGRREAARHALRAAFYLWLAVLNLVATSAVWARLADAFPSAAALRLFGFLGAGATLGTYQEYLVALRRSAGRLTTVCCVASEAAVKQIGLGIINCLAGNTQVAPLLLSAGLLEGAGRCCASLALPSSPRGEPPPRDAGEKGVQGRRAGLWEGFQAVWASGYLRHIGAYLALSAASSSFAYFEKTLVIAGAAQDASGRMAIFALLNSTSAALIAAAQGCLIAAQLTATGRLLPLLGLPAALALGPAVAGGLLLGVGLAPVPLAVGAAEVIRKVVAYAVARPAREALFTVLPRRDLYAAKGLLASRF